MNEDKKDEQDMTESLPDEVLASIFSCLEAVALLDVVPLVCKRWYQLSKHPDSWRYIDLVVPCNLSWEDVAGNQLLRVAKVAPYLRALDFHMVDTLYSNVETVIGLVLQSDKIVKSLHTFPQCTKRMQAHTKKLLKKCLPSLRKIEFSCNNGHSKVAANFHKGVNELLQIISEAPRLSYLIFDLHLMVSFKGYTGQLGKGCSALKQFAVNNYQSSLASVYDPIILDVLRNKKNQLVDFEINPEVSDNVANALSECHSIKKCHLPLSNLPLIESMSQLHELVIGFLSLTSSVQSFPTVETFFKSSNVLTNISKLNIWGQMRWYNIYPSVDKSANILKLLTHKCKNVTVLRLLDICLPGDVFDSLLTNFQNLQEIVLQNCAGIQEHHISKLCELSSLRVVDMTDLIVNKVEEIETFQSAFENLQHCKPNAVITLKCRLSPYGEDIDCDEFSTDDEDDIYDGYDYDYDDDYNFTYLDYLRNKYGEDMSDMDLMALASSDED